MIVACTGHRPGRLPEGAGDRFEAWLSAMRNTVDGKEMRVISGMASGFDTEVAIRCVKLGVPFWAAVPWVGFAGNWEPVYKAVYLELLDQAERIEIVCDTTEYKPWVYEKRDQWMVDNSDLLVSAWDGVERGGTWNTVRYAVKRGRQDRIVHLFP